MDLVKQSSCFHAVSGWSHHEYNPFGCPRTYSALGDLAQDLKLSSGKAGGGGESEGGELHCDVGGLGFFSGLYGETINRKVIINKRVKLVFEKETRIGEFRNNRLGKKGQDRQRGMRKTTLLEIHQHRRFPTPERLNPPGGVALKADVDTGQSSMSLSIPCSSPFRRCSNRKITTTHVDSQS